MDSIQIRSALRQEIRRIIRDEYAIASAKEPMPGALNLMRNIVKERVGGLLDPLNLLGVMRRTPFTQEEFIDFLINEERKRRNHQDQLAGRLHRPATDAHTERAIREGIPRDLAKRLNFAERYGAGMSAVERGMLSSVEGRVYQHFGGPSKDTFVLGTKYLTISGDVPTKADSQPNLNCRCVATPVLPKEKKMNKVKKFHVVQLTSDGSPYFCALGFDTLPDATAAAKSLVDKTSEEAVIMKMVAVAKRKEMPIVVESVK